jgi:sugar phosphate isomerase/epimerase
VDRRTAIATLAGLVAAPRCADPPPAAPNVPPRPIGIQLYTLRGLLEQDLEGTLAAVAEIGYREVEFHDYFGRSPAGIREAVARAGLTAPAVHVDGQRLAEGWDQAIDDALAAGHHYIVIAWIPPQWRTTLDDWYAFADRMNQAGALAAARGLPLAYHNHEFEFHPIDGTLPYDEFLHRTDSGAVLLELDFYWCALPGQNPQEWLTRGAGRYRMVHVKDMGPGPDRAMVDPGRGVLDFPTLLRAADEAGVKHWFVEHDHPADPLATARAGYRYLSGLAI